NGHGRWAGRSMTAMRSQPSAPLKSKPAPPRAPALRASWFTRFAKWTACNAGRPSSFLLAMVVIVVWAVTGPLFHFSDTWQLVINTGTTIVTFLMVFLIQNTQNRDSQAIHVKLDELIRAKKGARNSLLDLDDLTDEELERLRASFTKMGAQARREHLDALEDEVDGAEAVPAKNGSPAQGRRG
ncbi:MAG TPA: low affinity iron permease family protein, partial [Opitutaceae bacterium]|nr:low affinity iron permease family protein [Opitutaceae bacterium]